MFSRLRPNKSEPAAGDDPEEIEEVEPTRRRPWLTARRSDDVTEEDLDLKPTAMRGTEAMYGYVVALELVVVSVLNLTVTHGKGAPAHPSTTMATIGLVASIALLGVVRMTHHRLVVPFAAIIAAFFATLPKVPNSLALAHLFALILPVIYAFVLTQRQRKTASAQVKARRTAARTAAATGPGPGRDRARGKSDPASGRRSRRTAAVPTGPQRNRRYTPPKAKRPRR